MSRRTRLRTFAAILLTAALVFPAAAAEKPPKRVQPPQRTSRPPIAAKIGVVSIVTGAGSGYGEAITNGLKLAKNEINARGAVKLELVIEDSTGKAEQALSATQKLINSEKVVAIIGPTLSTEMKVAGPEANASGVPIMGTSTTAKGITQIGKYVFRNSLPEALAIPLAIKAAVKKYNIRKIALLYGNDDVFTKSGFDTMKEVSDSQGLKILTIETFQKGQADYKAQLTKIKSPSPDAVFCSALYEEGGVILAQARKMGIGVPFVGGNGFNSPKVIEIAKEAANGLIVASPWWYAKNDPKVKGFVDKYRKTYGKVPDQFAAQAYDALHIVAEALVRAGAADREKLRDALAATRNFEGVLATFSFDADRDVATTPYVMIIKDKDFKLFR